MITCIITSTSYHISLNIALASCMPRRVVPEEGRANHSMMAQNWSPHECQKDIRGCFQKRSFASTPWMWFVNGATELGASCHRPALLQTSMAAVVLLVVRKLCLHISFRNCSAHSCVIMAPATGITWTAMNLAAGVYHQQNSNGSNFSQTWSGYNYVKLRNYVTEFLNP